MNNAHVKEKYKGLFLSNAMLAHKGLQLTTKLVFLVLTECVNGETADGLETCTIRQEDIAKKLGISTQTVWTSINKLAKIGVIKRGKPITIEQKHQGFCSTYIFLKDSFCNEEDYKPFKPDIPEGYSELHAIINGEHIVKIVRDEDLPERYRNAIEDDQMPDKKILCEGDKPAPSSDKKILCYINNNMNTNIQDNNHISNSFAKAKLRGDSSNPPQGESSSFCGTIKLNRRNQKHLSDNQVPLIPTSQESLSDVQSLPAKEPIKQANVPATASTTKSNAQIIRDKAKEQRDNQTQPELFIPTNVKEIVNFWESQEIKGKKLYVAKKEFYETKQKGIKNIQDLLRSYTPDQINVSIHRFSLATLNEDYYPVDKTKTERLTLLGFLFGKYKDRKTGMLVSNGYFKQYMEEPPKLITQLKPDKHKEITIRLQNRYSKEIAGGLELKQLSPAQKIERQNMFIEAAEEIYNFCTKNKDRLNYMPKSDMADLLFDAVLSVAGNKATSFTIGRLKSNVTLTQVLPAFAFAKGYANDMVPQDIRPISDYYNDQPQSAPQDYDPDDQDIFDEEDAARVELTEEQKAEQRAAQIEQQKAEAAFEERCRNRGAKLKEMPASVPNGFRQRHGMLYDESEDD